MPTPPSTRPAGCCAGTGLFTVIGITEREDERPGTLCKTMLLLGPEGFLMRHRKLMPTMHERLFHDVGAGDDLDVVATPIGRRRPPDLLGEPDAAGALLAASAGPQIWVAPTADDSDGWLATVRSIAIESGAFVVSTIQYIPASAFPADFPVRLPEEHEVFGRGGTAIIEPTMGDIVAGPLYDEEWILYADCDLRRGLEAERWFDVVGHYSREDVWRPGTSPEPERASDRPAESDPARQEGQRSSRGPLAPPRRASLVTIAATTATPRPVDRAGPRLGS